MSEFLQILFWAATSSIFLKLGKYLDFRLGARFIADLKNGHHLERLWFAIARQSPRRFSYRVLRLIEQLFSRLFGSNPFALQSLLRFAGFSFSLNLLLAFSAILFTVPLAKLLQLLFRGDGTLLATAFFLVVINIPLDIGAYLFTRTAIRSSLDKSLCYMIVLIGTSIAISYLFAVLSTTIGGALTTFALFDLSTALSVAPSIIAHWIPLALAAPFTSQVQLNGTNIGYLAIGALPSVFVAGVVLLFMFLLRTLAHCVHYEFCMNTGRVLDDKKSFFEHIAMLASIALLALWSVLKIILWSATHLLT